MVRVISELIVERVMRATENGVETTTKQKHKIVENSS